MAPDELNREQLERACVALSQVLQELLDAGKIDAQEFLSIIACLPVRLADLNPKKWTI